jgi:hypothetical protein
MDPSCDSFETPKRDLRGNSSKSADAKIINTVGTSAKILLRLYEPRNAQGKRKMVVKKYFILCQNCIKGKYIHVSLFQVF